MNKFIFCCILITICGQDAWCKNRRHKKNQDNDNEGKIVGGNHTTIETHPYQAYLLTYDGIHYYQCGGSIISKYYILTAAHCLTSMRRIYVRIGSTNSGSGGTQYETTSFFYHPKYNGRTSDYDAGLVRIPRGMNLDGVNARSIGLVNRGYDPPEGENVVLTGWGDTAENGSVSQTLMVVEVPVVSRARCNEVYSGSITARMFCAGLPEGGKDTCQGDSGGPAVVNSTERQAGITSFGYGCARPNTPGVYTLIGNTEIRQFIRTFAGV